VLILPAQQHRQLVLAIVQQRRHGPGHGHPAVSLVNGAVSVSLGIVLASAVTTIMTNDDVRGWYRHGRY
jgi:hypothetical protein